MNAVLRMPGLLAQKVLARAEIAFWQLLIVVMKQLGWFRSLLPAEPKGRMPAGFKWKRWLAWTAVCAGAGLLVGFILGLI
jgi:hypothetical protein